MKIHPIARYLGVMALVAAFALMAYAKQEAKEEKGEETKVEMSQVPPAAQAAIEKAAAGAKIEEIVKETEEGKVVYEATWTKDGEEAEVKVTAEGQIVKEDEESEKEEKEEGEEESAKEEKIELSAAPAAVQAAVKKAIGSGSLTALTTEEEEGVKMYEAEYTTADGMKDSVVVDAAGTVCEKEEQVKDIPAAVNAALANAFPNAEIGEAVVATKTVYEVTITVDGKKKEIKVSPAGQIEKAHKEWKGKEGKEGKKAEKEGDEDDDD